MKRLRTKSPRLRHPTQTVLSTIAMCMMGAALVAVIAGHATVERRFVLTGPNGVTVPNNSYADKCDVYLSIKPRRHETPLDHSSQIRRYYYQVTSTSGRVLLAGPGASPAPDTSTNTLAVDGTGASTPIQLCPYDDPPTHNAKKAKYKVWVTEVSDFQPGDGVYGFLPNSSIILKFQVRNLTHQDHDDNGNGGSGGGNGNGGSGGGNGNGGSGGGNNLVAGPMVNVNKFYDMNANGIHDLGELLLTGFRIALTGPSQATSSVTPSSLPLTDPGTYVMGEIMPQGSWLQTAVRVDGSYTNAGLPSLIPAEANFAFTGESHEVLFGNICLGAGGAKALEFWTTSAGEAAMNSQPGNMSQAIAMLISLILRDDQGRDFDPASYDHLRSWLLSSSSSSNMAYRLSAQLVAMILSVQISAASPTALIWTGSDFTTMDLLMGMAIESIGLHGYTPLGDPNRSAQEDLTHSLSQANNNLSFVQANPCSISY